MWPTPTFGLGTRGMVDKSDLYIKDRTKKWGWGWNLGRPSILSAHELVLGWHL